MWIAKYNDPELGIAELTVNQLKPFQGSGGSSWALKSSLKTVGKFEEVIDADVCTRTLRDDGTSLKQLLSGMISRISGEKDASYDALMKITGPVDPDRQMMWFQQDAIGLVITLLQVIFEKPERRGMKNDAWSSARGSDTGPSQHCLGVPVWVCTVIILHTLYCVPNYLLYLCPNVVFMTLIV